MPFLFQRFAANVIHQIMGVLSANVGAQAHHGGFRHHQAIGHVDVAKHLSRIHFKARQNKFRLLQGTGH
jgi:hypothetical protein